MLFALAASLAAPAWALPADLDPAITANIGPREDAVGRYDDDAGATAFLVEVLKTDPAVEVRAAAAATLFSRWAKGVGDPDEHRAIALWAADNADDGVRAAAVRALADTGDDYTLVVKYLDDDSAAVRAAAFSGCERWAERHPDRATEARAALSGHELTMEGKARRLFETVRSKIP